MLYILNMRCIYKYLSKAYIWYILALHEKIKEFLWAQTNAAGSNETITTAGPINNIILN